VEREWVQESLSRVPVLLSAMIPSQLTARDLLAMAPGDVFSLGVPTHKPIDVMVGSTLKFKGRLAVESGRLGVRIEQHCTAAAGVEA